MESSRLHAGRLLFFVPGKARHNLAMAKLRKTHRYPEETPNITTD